MTVDRGLLALLEKGRELVGGIGVSGDDDKQDQTVAEAGGGAL